MGTFSNLFNQKLNQLLILRNRYRLAACAGSVADEVGSGTFGKKVLANPEMWALLNSLAKTMK